MLHTSLNRTEDFLSVELIIVEQNGLLLFRDSIAPAELVFVLNFLNISSA